MDTDSMMKMDQRESQAETRELSTMQITAGRTLGPGT